MPKNLGKSLVKIAFFSLVVGLLLAAFDIEPRALLQSFGETAQSIFEVVADVVEWSVKYVLLGAIVIVPLWLILVFYRAARDKMKS